MKVKKRIRRKPKQIPSKSELKRLYVKEEKTFREIGKIFALTPIRIRKLLVGYGIKIRKGGFKKGNTPWNKSKKTGFNKKQSVSLKKRFADGLVHPMQGKHHSKESRQQQSESHLKFLATKAGKKLSQKLIKFQFKKGQSSSPKTEFKKGQEPWNKDKIGVFTEEALEKIREARSKQKFPAKDTTPEKILQGLCNIVGIKFQKQKNFNLGFQRHPVDVFIEPNICIEADGDFPHANPHDYLIPSKTSTIQRGFKANKIIRNVSKSRKRPLLAKDIWKKDAKITQALEQQGNIVLRFWWSELETDPEKCLQKIIKIM